MLNNLPIYLDYAATTPLDPQVVAAMCDVLKSTDLYGNPASAHFYGWRAQEVIELARQEVAQWLQASPREIIWTSGATEANNFALKGAAQFHQERGRHIITLQTEHPAVLDTCNYLESVGFVVTYLRPQANGLLALEDLQQALRKDTILVSIMHVNNEIGIIQDLAPIAELVKAHGALFHVDAAQSVGKVLLNVQEIPVDLISLSAHKVYGPKGVGALYMRRKPRARAIPLLHGGGHEQGLRSGTLATHQIVGMGTAFRCATELFDQDSQHIFALRQQLLKGLADIPGVIINSDPAYSVPGIVNISCTDVEGEALLLAVEPQLAVSSGSACTTTRIEASHVLLALGIPAELAHSSLRLSFGRFTTSAEISTALEVLRAQLARLRALSSAWGT